MKTIDKEVKFEDVGVLNRPVISKTDLKGKIIFVNSAFCKLSGYQKEELIGQSHNVVRHPDMPKTIFKELWDTIEKNQNYRGIIKNLRKDGKYYWVEVFIEPIYDDNGKKIGYISVNKPVSNEDKKKYSEIYRQLKQKEQT
ncbi:MAG: PAS domain-containing protein [Epsilonproteobacteria bacterium]|nr:PAS domain-containing protein [Campylobacterota bacterium]